MPASRSSSAPNTLGESKRGRHIHSTAPLGATSAPVSQSERNPYWAIGGEGVDWPGERGGLAGEGGGGRAGGHAASSSREAAAGSSSSSSEPDSGATRLPGALGS